MNNAIKILEDELKRAKIRLGLVRRAHYDAHTTERFFRRELKEAQEKNEPQEVIDTMNGDLEMASAITTEARAMLAQADELCMIILKSFADIKDTHKVYKRRKTTEQEKSPFVTAFCISSAIVFVIGILLPFVLMLVSYFREQPTNTTMHQPELTGQYADSLVCPD